jgi:hypothetical protein
VEEEQMRVCDVVAAEDCECWELDVRDFVSATKHDMSSNADVMKLLSTVSDDRLEEALRLGVKSLDFRTSGLCEERSSGGRPQGSSSPPSPLSGVGYYFKDAVSPKDAVSSQTVASNAERQYLMAVDSSAQVLNPDGFKCMQRHIAPALDFFGSLSPVSRASCVGCLKVYFFVPVPLPRYPCLLKVHVNRVHNPFAAILAHSRILPLPPSYWRTLLFCSFDQ